MGKKKETTKRPHSLRIASNALQDIDEITSYIAFINHQHLNAIKVGDALFEKIERIATHPFAYKECEELPTKLKIYRQANCMAWQIIFKITINEIVILGIIHHSRRPSKLRRLKNIS